MARGHTTTVIKMLAGIVTRDDAPAAARIAAGRELLDRGWGKPTQNVNLNDGRPMTVEIVNQIVRPQDPDYRAVVIERQGPNGPEVIELYGDDAERVLAPKSDPVPELEFTPAAT